MLTIDKIFHASLVLKEIIRPTPLARAYGFSKDFTLLQARKSAENRLLQASWFRL